MRERNGMEKTEEKHVAECLRERSQLLRTLGEFSCKDFMTYEFGISSPCNGRRCSDCYADMFERIADRIDREMVEKERLKKENAELREMLACWQNYHLNMIARAKKFAGIKDGGSK